MRFKLKLQRQGSQRFLPLNYQYELSAAIYRIIHRGNSEFSSFLHNQGYRVGERPFRLFTFSRLFLDTQKTHPTRGRIEHIGQHAEVQVSFLIDRAAEEFIKGVFWNEEIFIGDQISGATYQVICIEACPVPLFREIMSYRCLSPILIKQKRPDGGENYLDPAHSNYGTILVKNLISKWLAKNATVSIQDTISDQDDLDFDFNLSGKAYKNGVLIKQMTAQETKLIGYSFKFDLRMSPELHEIGFYSGFGHLGSQGFGCVEVKNEMI
jgi:CRISPR-associated endoribonuclease Cas6